MADGAYIEHVRSPTVLVYEPLIKMVLMIDDVSIVNLVVRGFN